MSSVIKPQSPFERLKVENDSPEIALARAIILQAIIDASSTSSSKQATKMKNEAFKWLFEDSEHFLEICTDAEFKPEYVRNIAKEMLNMHYKSQIFGLQG
jgi:hypothetical protein